MQCRILLLLVIVVALNPLSLWSEFSHVDGDSDIEAEDEEFVAVMHCNAAPVLRQPLETNELEDGQNPDDTTIEGWRVGTMIPENLIFTGRSGLLVDVDGDIPLDHFNLMVKDHMIESLVEETTAMSSRHWWGMT